MENWEKIFIDEKETNYSVSNLGNVRNDNTKNYYHKELNKDINMLLYQ